MKTTIVKSLSGESIFGQNKSHKANLTKNRKRSTSGVYNVSLNLYMNRCNRNTLNQNGRLQTIYDQGSTDATIYGEEYYGT